MKKNPLILTQPFLSLLGLPLNKLDNNGSSFPGEGSGTGNELFFIRMLLLTYTNLPGNTTESMGIHSNPVAIYN